jgi:prophage antirepressor-like protein
MSSNLAFDFQAQTVQVFITEDKKELFHGADVCRALGRSDNFARTIKTFVKSRWWIEYPNPKGGKPILCLFEPGLYQLATNQVFDSEFASSFQDLVFEEVLPKLRADGFYLSEAATYQQLIAANQKIQALYGKRRVELTKTKDGVLMKVTKLGQLEYKTMLVDGARQSQINPQILISPVGGGFWTVDIDSPLREAYSSFCDYCGAASKNDWTRYEIEDWIRVNWSLSKL